MGDTLCTECYVIINFSPILQLKCGQEISVLIFFELTVICQSIFESWKVFETILLSFLWGNSEKNVLDQNGGAGEHVLHGKVWTLAGPPICGAGVRLVFISGQFIHIILSLCSENEMVPRPRHCLYQVHWVVDLGRVFMSLLSAIFLRMKSTKGSICYKNTALFLLRLTFVKLNW